MNKFDRKNKDKILEAIRRNKLPKVIFLGTEVNSDIIEDGVIIGGNRRGKPFYLNVVGEI